MQRERAPRCPQQLRLGRELSLSLLHGQQALITSANSAASQGLHSQEAGVKSQSWVSNPRTPVVGRGYIAVY